MMNEQKRAVTIEDLLRLKRAERPSPEFWERFNRELRAKQLAALVERRPWWRRLPELSFSTWRRFHRPLGAVALLGLTFISVQEYRSRAKVAPVASLQGEVSVVMERSGEAATPLNESNRSATELLAVAAAESASAERNSVVSAEPQPVVASNASAEPATKESEQFASLAAERSDVANDFSSQVAPPSRQITAQLGVVQIDEVFLGKRLLGGSALTEGKQARARTEPLAQIASATTSRIASRFGNAMAMTVGAQGAPRANERVARDLSSERLTDEQIRRIAARGDSVSWKW